MNHQAALCACRAILAACSIAGLWHGVPVHAANQEAGQREIGDVLATDLDFAALAFESGLGLAYDRYLDVDAILFRPLPLPGREWLATHEPASGRVEWTPALATAACDGSLAITLGTWKYTASDGKATESGQYLTAWRRNAEGDWRIVLDQSVALVPMPQAIGTTPSPARCLHASSKAASQLEKTDRKRNRSLRWQSLDAKLASRRLEAVTTGTVLGADQADLALTHGRVLEKVSGRGAEQKVRAVYIRVWQRSRSTWDVLLDLVTPVSP